MRLTPPVNARAIDAVLNNTKKRLTWQWRRWMPASGQYSLRVAPADAMVIDHRFWQKKIELWHCEIAFRS